MYRIAGRTAANAATAGAASFDFWNPHSTVRTRLAEIHICCNGAPAAGASLALRRATARGTATSTGTPDIDNDIQRAQAPTSGALLDLAFSAAPTLDASVLWQWTFAAVAGSAIILPVEISVPPGTGLCGANVGAIAFPASDITIVWREEF